MNLYNIVIMGNMPVRQITPEYRTELIKRHADAVRHGNFREAHTMLKLLIRGYTHCRWRDFPREAL